MTSIINYIIGLIAAIMLSTACNGEPTLEPTNIPTNVPTISAPVVVQSTAEYDVRAGEISLFFNIPTDAGDISELEQNDGFNCKNSGIFNPLYIDLIGENAECLWPNSREVRIIPSLDNTFTLNITNNKLAFEVGKIGTRREGIKQNDPNLLICNGIKVTNFESLPPPEFVLETNQCMNVATCDQLIVSITSSNGNYMQPFKSYEWIVRYRENGTDKIDITEYLLNGLNVTVDESEYNTMDKTKLRIDTIDLIWAIYETLEDGQDIHWPVELSITALLTNWLGKSGNQTVILTIFNEPTAPSL